MNLCSYNHEEICFEGRKCPLCEATSEKDQEIASLKADLSSLQEAIERLHAELLELS